MLVLPFAFTLFSTLAATSPSDCNNGRHVHFERQSDLPDGALSALGAPMAEKGQPYQATDVVSDPRLPIYRLLER